MWLLIDDTRDLNCDAIARTSDAAKKLLFIGGWECVVFDHDLGLKSQTGYDVLTWAIENDLLPNRVQLCTSNPVGRKRIEQALLMAGYLQKQNCGDFGK